MNKDNYEDIINLKHHVSTRHPQMSISQRAAQFAPFAALTGYEDNIKEATRLTDNKIEITEELKSILNNKLQIILNHLQEEPTITIIYFIYDNIKSGGKYVTKIGKIKKIDIIEGYLTLTDKTKIPINEIISIDSKLFNDYQI